MKKFTLALVLAICGCGVPDVQGQLPDEEGVGSVQQGSHFLSEQPCDDLEWTCNPSDPSHPFSHLTLNTNPVMRQMWLPLGGGPWTKVTLIYYPGSAIMALRSQWQPSRAGGSTSWCLEFTPTQWDPYAYWFTMNAACPGRPSSGGFYSPYLALTIDGVYSNEGQSWPVMIQPYIEIDAHFSDNVPHAWKTTNGTSWAQLY